MRNAAHRFASIAAVWLAVAAPAQAADRPAVPAPVRRAVEDYLRSEGKAEKAALEKALSALKGDVAIAAEALASHAPLASAKPGTRHGLTLWPTRSRTCASRTCCPGRASGRGSFPRPSPASCATRSRASRAVSVSLPHSAG